MLLKDIKDKIENEEYTGYLPTEPGMTSYQVCKSANPKMPGYWLTINTGFSSKPDKKHYASWDDLMQYKPSWPVQEATRWEVM